MSEGASLKRSQLLMILPAVVWVIVFLFIPLVTIFANSLYTLKGYGVIVPELTLKNYANLVLSPAESYALLWTLGFTLIITLICLLVGFPLAYFLSFIVKNDNVRTVLSLLLLIPLWVDSTTKIMAWFPVLGVNGVINSALTSLRILTAPSSFFILSPPAAIIVMVQSYYLFMAFPIFLSFVNIDRSIYEAAEVLGASRIQTFTRITLRLAKPGIIIGFVFTFVSVFGDYVTPFLVGGTIQTAGLVISQKLTAINLPDATALSAVMIAITMALVVLMFRFAALARSVV